MNKTYEWACEYCGTFNEAETRAASCGGCQAPMPEAVTVVKDYQEVVTREDYQDCVGTVAAMGYTSTRRDTMGTEYLADMGDTLPEPWQYMAHREIGGQAKIPEVVKRELSHTEWMTDDTSERPGLFAIIRAMFSRSVIG